MPTFASNGQQIAAGWNMSGSVAHFTAIAGVTDGLYFQPVDDRGRYSQGVLRNLPTGDIYYEGFTVVEFAHAWLSDGGIERLKTTYAGNCTLKHHIAESVTSSDLQTSNVVNATDWNQLSGLERISTGYKDFVSRWLIVEVL